VKSLSLIVVSIALDEPFLGRWERYSQHMTVGMNIQ